MRTAILQSVDARKLSANCPWNISSSLCGLRYCRPSSRSRRRSLPASMWVKSLALSPNPNAWGCSPDDTSASAAATPTTRSCASSSTSGLGAMLVTPTPDPAQEGGHLGRTFRLANCLLHYSAAGNLGDLRRVLEASIETIVATGDTALAADYVARFPQIEKSSAFEIVRSRLAASVADVGAAVEHARRAVEIDGDLDAANGNLLGTYFHAGELSPASDLAARLATSARTPGLRDVGAGTWHVLDVTLEGDLKQGIATLTEVAERTRKQGHSHYEGVSLLNTALMRRAQGAAPEVLRDAGEALAAFARGSAGWETLSAELAQAWATAHSGRLVEAREMMLAAAERCTSASRSEWLVEAADIELAYGDESSARTLVEEGGAASLNPSLGAMFVLSQVQLALTYGRSRSCAETPSGGPTFSPHARTRARQPLPCGTSLSIRIGCFRRCARTSTGSYRVRGSSGGKPLARLLPRVVGSHFR